MGRALPKVDESVRWPRCEQCGERHRRARLCAPVRVWLVAGSCRDCHTGPHGTRYCKRHDVVSYLTGGRKRERPGSTDG